MGSCPGTPRCYTSPPVRHRVRGSGTAAVKEALPPREGLHVPPTTSLRHVMFVQCLDLVSTRPPDSSRLVQTANQG